MQDSPAGWLAWVTQLFQEFVDREYIVTNAATYWLTGDHRLLVRRYFADAHTGARPTEPTTVPTAVAIFRDDFQTIRRLADRDHSNIVRWTKYDCGSHFSPTDAADLLLSDIREFFQPLR